MAQMQIEAWENRDHSYVLRHTWANLDRISPNLPLAVIASEDQKFPEHWGFDVEAIEKAYALNKHSHKVRGASTISQQVAKNLFLWSGRSYFRKGLEAYFTLLIEACWPKRRILEVYLNVAEFGMGTYGAEAAAQRFFHKSAARLTRSDAAVLAAVLPNLATLLRRFTLALCSAAARTNIASNAGSWWPRDAQRDRCLPGCQPLSSQALYEQESHLDRAPVADGGCRYLHWRLASPRAA